MVCYVYVRATCEDSNEVNSVLDYFNNLNLGLKTDLLHTEISGTIILAEFEVTTFANTLPNTEPIKNYEYAIFSERSLNRDVLLKSNSISLVEYLCHCGYVNYDYTQDLRPVHTPFIGQALDEIHEYYQDIIERQKHKRYYTYPTSITPYILILAGSLIFLLLL